MTRKLVLGPDVDLDVEVVLDRRGRRITERRAEQIGLEAVAKSTVGRPSLTAPGTHSPEIKARVPAELRDRLTATATARGMSNSELIREALERHLAF
jgi:hypothetical protein